MNYSALFKTNLNIGKCFHTPNVISDRSKAGRLGNPGLPVLMMFTALRLYHECSDECKDRIELRECGVDHSVCLNVVAL